MVSKTINVFIPIFMSGHDGDMEWIEGIKTAGDIFIGEEKVGSFTKTFMVINPPTSFTGSCKNAFGSFKIVNEISNLGTFEVTGIGISMASSTMSTDFTTTYSWTGTISNGTDALSNLVGLSSGTAEINFAASKGVSQELILYRMGF